MTKKISHLLLAMLLVSSLGPYLPGGVRLDHIVSLGVMMCAIWIFVSGATLPRSIAWPLAMIAISFGLMVTFDAFSGEPDVERKVMYSAVFLRLFQPIEILFSLAVLVRYLSPDSLRSLVRLVIRLAAVAGAYSLLSVVANVAAIQNFYVAGDLEQSVWFQAYSIHRYTGFFNQPMEAGVYFSVALLLWLHQMITSPNGRRRGLLICGALILAGGMLSLSKNFTVLGLGMVAYVMYCHGRRRIFWGSVLIGVALVGAGVVMMAADSAYLESYVTLYDQGGFFYALSAGRFGETESPMKALIAQYIDQGFWTGLGMGSEQTFDSGYLEYFYQGGFASGLLYAAFFVYFASRGWKCRRLIEGRMLLALSVYALLCSLGGAMLALNRANIVFLFSLTFCLTAAARSASGQSQVSRNTAPRRLGRPG